MRIQEKRRKREADEELELKKALELSAAASPVRLLL